MAKYSFDYVMEDAITFIVSPGCSTENSGYFTNLRVDRDTLPEGWYAYDIRHGDSGGLWGVEEFVLVNHAGTFLTQQPMKMNAKGFHCLRGGGGYTFGDPYKIRRNNYAYGIHAH